MKIATQPNVKLVGQSGLDPEAFMEFLDEHGIEWPEFEAKYEEAAKIGEEALHDLIDDPSWIMELGGRTCYMSFGGKGRSHEDHIRHIIEVGHGSVLEHISFNFQIWNVSRSLTHELVRHRAGFAFSQLSQRYVGGENIDFVLPPSLAELFKTIGDPLYKKWVQHMENSLALYGELTDALAELYQDLPDKTERRKKARQAARSVLPNATETKILVSANARAVRHFIEMRANPAADLEIRQLAIEIYKIMADKFPLVVYGMELVKLVDGSDGVESKFKKV